MPLWAKILTVVPAVIDGVKFIVKTVKQRKKGKLTDEQREQAAKDAADELDRILKAAQKAQGKK